MKRLLHFFPFLLLLAATLTFISCGKDGAAGPAGEQGQKGDKGDGGPAGPSGPKGDPGTANVIYSNWLTVTFKPDTVILNGRIDTLGYYADIDAPKLTKEILNTGEVKIYINFNTAADPVITSIPYRGENGAYINFVAYEKTISLYSNLSASTITTGAGEKIQQYRYIIIPGGTAARSANAVDWKNYAAVKAYLGLKD